MENARSTMGKASNFVTLPFAVTDFDGYAQFHLNVLDGTSSLLPFDQHAKSTSEWRDFPDLVVEKIIDVPTIRLDTFFDRMAIREVEFLKIDTQGNDLKVVQSAGDRIKDIAKITLEVDITPVSLYHGSSGKKETIAYMKSVGMKLVSVESQSKGLEENLTFVHG